jgi:hypothetical protein
MFGVKMNISTGPSKLFEFSRNCEAFPIRGWCVRLYMNLPYVLFGDYYEPFSRHSPDHVTLVVAKPILSSHFFVTYALSQELVFLVSTFSARRRTHDEHAFPSLRDFKHESNGQYNEQSHPKCILPNRGLLRSYGGAYWR